MKHIKNIIQIVAF